MFRRRLVIQALFLLLCIASCMAWSEKKHRDHSQAGVHKKPSTPEPVVAASEDVASFEEGHESKPKARFASSGHPSGGDQYIYEEDDGHVVGEDEGEFIDEEGREEEYGQEQERGYQHDDKKVDDETQKDFKQTGAYQDFSQGGAVFDKHHKDVESENKANEDIKQHDAGEKFGSEALKEHKLGKHKEKSKGHKKYGFKNVYHKEEYGDHKTFHDEFLDNDHFHDYDDKHEHKQMQGGRFAKGYKKSGENKEHDVGDEKHAWGKAGHDGNAEGHYEKGGHLAGHHHGHKKQEGHFDANSSHGKKSEHKIRKGEVPVVSSVYHQGGEKPQYYSQVYHAQDDPVHLHDEAVVPDHHYGSYHARHSGIQNDKPKHTKVYPDDHLGSYHARNSGFLKAKDKPIKVYPGHHYESKDARHSGTQKDQDKTIKVGRGLRPAEVFQYHEQRSPVEARRLEVPVNERYSEKDIEKFHQPVKDIQPIRDILPSNEGHKVHSYHYGHPESDKSFPEKDRISKYREQHGISEPLKSHHHHHKQLPTVHPSKLELSVPHSFQYSQHNEHIPSGHHAESNLHQHQPRDHGHHHFLIHPHGHQDSRSHQHHQTDDVSNPYPWWEASSSAKKHHQTRNFNQSPSYRHYGYAEVPKQTVPWRHRDHLMNEDHDEAASQQRPGYVREPKKVEWKRVKSHHHHN